MGAGTPAKSATRSLYGYTVSTYADGFANRAMPSFDPEACIGAQAPLGFWDPLDLTDPFDEEEFNRRRAVEVFCFLPPTHFSNMSHPTFPISHRLFLFF